MTREIEVKMARPDTDQFRAMMAFMQMLEGLIEHRIYPPIDDDDTNPKTVESLHDAFDFIEKEWPKVDWCFTRVIMAGEVCIDNACDPNESALEFKPEIKLAMEQHERLTAALHAHKCHPDYSYLIVPAGGMTPGGRTILDKDDWERCPEGDPGGGDECWRRRITP